MNTFFPQNLKEWILNIFVGRKPIMRLVWQIFSIQPSIYTVFAVLSWVKTWRDGRFQSNIIIHDSLKRTRASWLRKKYDIFSCHKHRSGNFDGKQPIQSMYSMPCYCIIFSNQPSSKIWSSRILVDIYLNVNYETLIFLKILQLTFP